MGNLEQAIRLLQQEAKRRKGLSKPIMCRSDYWEALTIANSSDVACVEIVQSDETGPMLWAVAVGEFWLEAFETEEEAIRFVTEHLPNKKFVVHK